MARYATLEWPGAMIGKGSVSRNNSLGVLSGIAPLAEKFVYLNFRYLVAVFYCFDHTLKRGLKTLRELNLGRCIAGYSDVLPLNHLSHLHDTIFRRSWLLIL
jgi:hypothetical protein